MYKQKIIIILGQTATGKSDLAVDLAGMLAVSGVESEIISADSRQVYKGLNLGTGKITKKEMQSIPHHLLDVISPKKRFSVSEYKKLAEKAIEKILKKPARPDDPRQNDSVGLGSGGGKVPIIVGGTGFYIQTITDNVVYPKVKPDSKLRQKLSKLNTEKLFQILKNLDPQRAKNIDAKNPHRLIRAIEIAKALGKVPKIKKGESKWQTLQIGVKLPDKILKERIHKRLLARINPPAGGGMINEAKKLHKQGLSWKRMEELGLEYRYLALYLQSKITKTEMIELLNTAIWQYAKRQWTWFKRDKRICWFDVSKKSNLKKIEKLVKKFLGQDLILSR